MRYSTTVPGQFVLIRKLKAVATKSQFCAMYHNKSIYLWALQTYHTWFSKNVWFTLCIYFFAYKQTLLQQVYTQKKGCSMGSILSYWPSWYVNKWLFKYKKNIGQPPFSKIPAHQVQSPKKTAFWIQKVCFKTDSYSPHANKTF